MADLLIRHLKEKSKDHSALEMLVNQWGFDEKLIPRALQSIGNLFPHYSSHDESHSKQILINIERLLGNENISKLTAIDTWLLLEAAYWHDIGMVVPEQDKKDAFDNLDFQRYLTQIKNTPRHELHKFCLTFDPKDVNKCFAGAETPMDAMNKLQQLMAEWFRTQHANRASTIVEAPWERIGVSSPRTELIPKRLFILLGRICHMHGLPFQDVLGLNGLPFREAGLAQEDCHPRFVACLLRMGDLLDIDDNRFCPVMQRIAGDDRPEMSKAHEDKHASIRHLRVDRDRIEISAECATVDGYLETYKWFDWLRQEIQHQTVRWLDIVPSREFGVLPTLGSIKVSLGGNQQLLGEGQRPEFSLDSEQAIKLLQGENLYSTKFACIRELLQNAVDATLLKIWLTKEGDNSEWHSPLSKTPEQYFKKNPVEINLIENPELETSAEKTAWTLSIKDQGTGISKSDLKYMLRIGGSTKNYSRKEKINTMPEWMKPSGAFGIGLQSVFMVSDHIKIKTKSIFSNEAMNITMYDPKGKKQGLVTIEILEQDISEPYGTTLEILFTLEKKSSRWTTSWNSDECLSDRLVNNHDPILDESFPFEATKLVDSIQEFSKYTTLPIIGNFNGGGLSLIFKEHLKRQKNNINFIEIDNHKILFQYAIMPSISSRAIHQTTYRGQNFEYNIDLSSYIYIHIDLLSGEAGNWLNFSRDKITNSAKFELSTLTLKALKKQITSDLNGTINFPEKEKEILSLFLKIESLSDPSWQSTYSKIEKLWHNLTFGIDRKENYKSLSKKSEWLISKAIDHTKSPPDKEENCDLLIIPKIAIDVVALYANEWLNKPKHSIGVLESSYYNAKNKNLRYRFSKSPQKMYNKKSLSSALIQAKGSSYHNIRYLLNTIDTRWENLYIKKESKLPHGIAYLFNISPANSKIILLPFLYLYNNHTKPSIRVTSDELEKLSNKILPYLENTKNIDEIKKTYASLVNYIDNDIMKPSPFWYEWREARCLENNQNITEPKES